MRQKIKIRLKCLFQPRLMTFCFAAYIFTSLWQSAQLKILCLLSPWCVPWRYDNEPTLILLASMFLLLNKRWSDLTTAILSGYILTHGVYIIIFEWGWANWLNSWSHFSDFLLEPIGLPDFWNTQIVFALIVFLLSVYYLIKRGSNKFIR